MPESLTSCILERVGVTANALQRLEELVLGEFDPGQELPSESKLAVQLGVSRLTVREATRSLQARGLVEIRHGRRPVVAHLDGGPIGDFFTAVVRRDPRRLLELLEVRRGLEVHIAGLAATQASRAAATGIEMALSAMQAAGDDLQAFHEADIAFHEAVAAASGNQMLSFLVEAMREPLHASRMRSLHGHLARGYDLEELIGQHARILQRIKARDHDGAAAAMRLHLEQTARDLKAALSFSDSPPGPLTPDR